MFGIDLGITVSSVFCVGGNKEPLDSRIIFGDTTLKDDWKRVTLMADTIVDSVDYICKAYPGEYAIMPYVSIEEPVYSYRTKNPRSFFNLACLYALLRNKLSKRGFEIYSINPVSVKTTAKARGFKGKKINNNKYAVRGRLTKKGMVLAFKRLNGAEPNYQNAVGRETLADSFFIALTGLERREVGVK